MCFFKNKRSLSEEIADVENCYRPYKAPQGLTTLLKDVRDSQMWPEKVRRKDWPSDRYVTLKKSYYRDDESTVIVTFDGRRLHDKTLTFVGVTERDSEWQMSAELADGYEWEIYNETL